MDPALDPPLRMTFLHPGRTLSLSEAQGNIANFLANRAERIHASSGGATAGTEADSISAPLMRLNSALKEAAIREARGDVPSTEP
ncbi:unnamed protein product [Parajaminaea phylloscopi]